MTMLMNQSDARRDKLFVPVLFTVTIFTSALLLFFVQPLFTRLVLPQIGGAAAVWTTAMLFFQTVLIGGYVYAHLLTRHVPVRLQIVVHLGEDAESVLRLRDWTHVKDEFRGIDDFLVTLIRRFLANERIEPTTSASFFRSYWQW